MTKIKYVGLSKLKARYEAFPYQMEAFTALKDLPYSAIFHEQGLGKTKIAIDLSLYWLLNKDIDCVFVVTKKQLVNNWVKEIENHTYIKARVLDSNKGNNYVVLNGTSRMIVTNFETVMSESERLKHYLKIRNIAVIIDESTKLKNPDAKITKLFFELSHYFKIKTIMTGTPVANRPYDIWSQIYFLDNGHSLGEDFQEFKKKTDLSNKMIDNSDVKKEFVETVGDIFDRISAFTVRETKQTSGISLPQKRYETIHANFEKQQSMLYMRIKKELSVEIEKEGKRIIDDDSETLKRLIRLNQVSSNPRLIDDSYDQISGKEEQLDSLLCQMSKTSEKCIIWSSFIENVEMFVRKYQSSGARKIHGGMTIEERNKSVEDFKNDPSCLFLFATPQAAKEGLTLTVANKCIFYDRTFNLDDYLQAQDRIHRISQTKECVIYKIVIDEGIDKWIDSLLSAKQHAAYLAQGDISSEEYESIADYSYGKLIKEILEDEQDA